MEKLKALCVVAHPDDCVIFARPFIEYADQYEWTILYLTYKDTDARAQEMQQYWSQQGVETVFLGYVDDYRDIENQQVSFEEHMARWQLIGYARRYDLLLTHAQDGDYGHIHHKFVHDAVASLRGVPAVYFSSSQESNFSYTCQEQLNLDQFPLHQAVIAQFDNINTGYYYIPDLTKNLIKQNAATDT